MKTDVQEQILNATIKLLQDNREPASITVRDIATEANVQLSMINYYFRSKDELMYRAVCALRYKAASEWLSIKDNSISAYERLRGMLISICDMSIKHSRYMKFTVEYELTKAEVVAPQNVLSLIREICGDKRSEISIRITAYEIISLLQLMFLRARDLNKYLGVDDVLEYDQMVEIIDTILASHFPV
jgi:AcrR family transcriptional regulator